MMQFNKIHNFHQFDDGKALRNMLDKQQNAVQKPVVEKASSAQNPAKNEEWSFWDFLDFINPLQHIPVVSSIYRHITGDEIKAPARIIGGTLFGGAIGAAASIINAALEEGSGKDVGAHVLAIVIPESKPSSSAGSSLAQATKKEDTPVIEVRGKNFVDHHGEKIITASASSFSMQEALNQSRMWETHHALEQYQKTYDMTRNSF